MPTHARWALAVALASLAMAGCHRKEFVRNRSVAMDPPLVAADPALTDPVLIDPGLTDPRRATFVDRHPLLRKPVEYYESSGPSPLRRMAAATVIGVPAGVLGEMRQIVVGCPPGF